MNRFLFSLSTLLLLSLPVVAEEAPAVPEKLKGWFNLARTERVAIVGIGDSNQRFGGHGYSFHLEKTFAQTYGSYATSLLLYREFKEKDKPAPAPAPDALAALAYSHWYIEPGKSETPSWRNGLLIVPKDHPLGVQGNLRFHLTYGTFEKDAGSFTPTIRRDETPWTIIQAEKKPIQPNSPTPQLVHYTLDLPADAQRNYPVQFSPSPLNSPIAGPAFFSSALCENLDQKHGIAYHTLYAVGGQSLYDMCNTFQKNGAARLAEFFSRVRDPLNEKKTCIVMITSGLNDRNEKEKSIGPNAGLASSSPEGYADNLAGIVHALQEAWVQAGGSADTIFFAFMPSHALSQPDDAKLVSYREAARTLAATLPNAATIDLEKLVPYAEMRDNHYYDAGTDTNPHLDRKGYQAIATALVNQLTK